MSLKPVELHKAYRLINHGPTVMVSAEFDGVRDVMSASWVCPLDYDKLTAVIGASSFTRSLFEKSGKFAVQVPFVSQAQLVAKMGTISMRADAGKLEGVEMFYEQGVPMVRGCAAWLVCKRIPEPHNEQNYDLFIGEVVAAYADERIFDGGHWLFEKIPDELKTLHYVSGGRYYLDGKAIDTKRTPIGGE